MGHRREGLWQAVLAKQSGEPALPPRRPVGQAPAPLLPLTEGVLPTPSALSESLVMLGSRHSLDLVVTKLSPGGHQAATRLHGTATSHANVALDP